MDLDTDVEEEHQSFGTTLVHIREHVAHSWRKSALHEDTWIVDRYEIGSVGLTSCWRVQHVRGRREAFSLRKIMIWRVFYFGGWINPHLTHRHPCIVEQSMSGFLVFYLYGLIPYFMLSSLTYCIYKGGESTFIHYHHWETLGARVQSLNLHQTIHLKLGNPRSQDHEMNLDYTLVTLG